MKLLTVDICMKTKKDEIVAGGGEPDALSCLQDYTLRLGCAWK